MPKNYYELLGGSRGALDPNKSYTEAEIHEHFNFTLEEQRKINKNAGQFLTMQRNLITARDELIRFISDSQAKQRYLQEQNLVNQNQTTRDAQNQAGQAANSPMVQNAVEARKKANELDVKNRDLARGVDRTRYNSGQDLLKWILLEYGVYKRSPIHDTIEWFRDKLSHDNDFDDLNQVRSVIPEQNENEFEQMVQDFHQRGDLIERQNPDGSTRYEYANPEAKQRFENAAAHLTIEPNAPAAAATQGNPAPTPSAPPSLRIS